MRITVPNHANKTCWKRTRPHPIISARLCSNISKNPPVIPCSTSRISLYLRPCTLHRARRMYITLHIERCTLHRACRMVHAVCCIGGVLLIVKRQVRRRRSDAFEHSHHARPILWADRALQSHSRSLWDTAVPQQHSTTVAGLLGSVSLQLLLAQ